MELFSVQFFAALAAIIVIDLVLAGDNAIVIALAARNLKPKLRKRAIWWGTFGAIAVRTLMTAIVVWLLRIPGLLALGGLLLLWIAYRLLVPKDDAGGGHHVDPADSFWSAMGTIIVADAMMGLDNVLAVAGAAHGSYLLVVLGLLISVPIIVWGSQLVLRLIDRFPGIIYLGAAVLAFTAAKMLSDEPAVKAALVNREALHLALYVGLVAGVLTLAFLRNRFRRQEQLEARLLDSVAQRSATLGEHRERVLIPVDGSQSALSAVQRAVRESAQSAGCEIHLVNVRGPLSRHIGRFLRRDDIEAWQRGAGMKALKSAIDFLTRQGVPFAYHVRVGQRAQVIAALADELQCDRILIGTARRNSLTRLLQDSVTSRLLDLTRVPLEVIVTRQRGAGDLIGQLLVTAAVLMALIALMAEI